MLNTDFLVLIQGNVSINFFTLLFKVFEFLKNPKDLKENYEWQKKNMYIMELFFLKL